MSGAEMWPWVTIAFLGVWHGVNPGMGWLFAAALGMQEGKGSAVWRALPPLALGHALAVGAALVVALSLGLAVSATHLRRGIAVILVGYGLFRLVRTGHPRYGGMKVGARDLTIWSFLMASAHGAGLMVLPFFVAGTGGGGHAGLAHGGSAHGGSAHAGSAHALASHVSPSHASPGGPGASPTEALADPVVAAIGSPELIEALSAVLLHTGAYLAVTGLLAALVVHWLGLRLLRTFWIDLDRIWAVTLILTGVLTAAM